MDFDTAVSNLENAYSGRPPGYTNSKIGSSKPLDALGFSPKFESPGVIKILNRSKTRVYHNPLVRNDESLTDSEQESENYDCMLSMLNNILPESKTVSGAKCRACIHPNSIKSVCLPAVTLLDSGALHASYIGRRFYESIRKDIPGTIKKVNHSVVLADGITKVPITEAVELYLSIPSPNGDRTYYVKDEFLIMDCHEEIIIGLPTIVRKLLSLFVEILNYAAAEYEVSRKEQDSLNVLIKEPWSVLEEPAPEDEETPIPCSFSDALHYLSISHEEAVQEYREMLPSHVSKEFAESTGIMDLLLSDLGIKVFVPKEWTGVKGVPDIKITFKEGMPARYKPPARPVNPKLYENAKKEFMRLCKYFYERSDSPIASPLVVAFKATPPFLRFCGDYTYINKFIKAGHWPIPNVFQALEKMSKFKVFLDFDLTNGFHQFKLDPETAKMLSVQTPWGQVQPKFLPEGVPIGSAWLQECMMNIFGDFEEFCIIIFDNLLAMAHDYQDAYEKVKLILERCDKHDLVLKMKKSWIGFARVNFFGYECRHGVIELTEERKLSVTSLPMPKNRTEMRKFLGCSGFFHKFIPNYAILTAPLHEMNKDKFDWNPKTWNKDYNAVFEKFKEALLEATKLYYPNYDLEWILRADASDYGVGFVLLQIAVIDGEEVLQPILFGSKKFSEQAQKWSTYAKEAFAMYFAIYSCQYYLRAKRFTYEGDHANLQWMESCTDAKVIRWRIFMQNFLFWFNHIAGSKNMVADWQSRFHLIFDDVETEETDIEDSDVSELDWIGALYEADEHQADDKDQFLNLVTRAKSYEKPLNPEPSPNEVSTEVVELSKQEMFDRAHSGRVGHNGIKATYEKLNTLFPGHGISMKELSDMFVFCEVCQMNNTYRATKLVPITRHLKVSGPREVIGIDYMDICEDEFGNKGVYVLKDHFTLLTYIYPTATKDYSDCALAIFMFCVTYGKFNALISDPGSELRSEGVALLNQWFGIEHKFSLIDRHESNGIENTNRLILKHLRNLAVDEDIAAYAKSVKTKCHNMLTGEKIRSRWSSPHIIGWVNFMLNKNSVNETGVSPYDLTFGSKAREYFDFPGSCLNADAAPKYLKVLSDDIAYLTQECREFQANLIAKRTQGNGPQNLYQKGDLVLWEMPDNRHKVSKLYGPNKGPYEVLSQVKNDVEVRHLATHLIRKFFVGELRLFYGKLEVAKAIAFADCDQHVVETILAYKGDPFKRTTMQFLVRFADEDLEWLPYSKDLFDTEAYGLFCSTHPELQFLLLEYKVAVRDMNNIRRLPIVLVQPGDVIYLDIRAFGFHWYQALTLPEPERMTYVVECTFGKRMPRNAITLECSLLHRSIIVDNVFVHLYCHRRKFVSADDLRLIDSDFVKAYPELLTDKLLSVDDFKYLIGKQFYDQRTVYTVVSITVTDQDDIVANVKPSRSSGVNAKKLIQYHVNSVVDLVTVFESRGEKRGTVTVGF